MAALSLEHKVLTQIDHQAPVLTMTGPMNVQHQYSKFCGMLELAERLGFAGRRLDVLKWWGDLLYEIRVGHIPVARFAECLDGISAVVTRMYGPSPEEATHESD